jgi:hypothetical protein
MNDRGIIASLFDLSFTHFIAPKLWRILYALFLVVAGICGIGVLFTIIGLANGFFGKVGGLLIGVPLAGLVFLLVAMYVRVIMEVLIVVFRGVDYLREINEKTRA